MRFGNNTKLLGKALVYGFIIGVAAYVFSAIMFVFYEKLPLARLIPLVSVIFIPPLVLGIVIIPTLVFSIHIDHEWVEHRVFDRWVLSRARSADFIKMEVPSGIFSAKLYFKDGTKMRFLAAHISVLASLESELQFLSDQAKEASVL